MVKVNEDRKDCDGELDSVDGYVDEEADCETSADGDSSLPIVRRGEDIGILKGTVGYGSLNKLIFCRPV